MKPPSTTFQDASSLSAPCATTAVIVNYFSAPLTLDAVRSVQATATLGPLRIVVVDNSCDGEEERVLRSALPGAVHLVVNSENVGFGRACNQIFDQSSDPLFLLLNPDARLLGNALVRLQQVLARDGRIGAISPQAFWDDACRFLIPPAHPPLLFLLRLPEARQGGRSVVHRLVGRYSRRRSLRVWRSRDPVRVSNLCGGHVLLRRTAVLRAGGLFDPSYFLYFEDTDLFVRMRTTGSRLMVDPLARAVHHYDQCDRENWARKRSLMQDAHGQYVRRHARSWHNWANRLLERRPLCRSGAGTGGDPEGYPVVDPYQELPVPEPLREAWLFEWSPNPDFIPAVGCFGTGPLFRFPAECLARLAPGRYFARFGARTPHGRLGPALSWTVDAGRCGAQ